MPAVGNIVINDGASTPVAHTFGPLFKEGQKFTFADRSGGISVGYPTISATLMMPTKASRLYKARMKVVLPVLEVLSNSTVSGITPAPTKSYDLTADITFYLPERSTLQNRKDILAYAKNLLAHTDIVALIQDNDAIY